jgi:thiol-disulfide isomerase/thioredoxin
MKKLWVITCWLFITTLITSGIISCDSRENNLSIKENTDSWGVDSLFSEMGILKVPHIASPVDFNLLNLNGKKVTLSDLKGKIVFLNFWTTWCSPCREEMPSMQTLYTRFKDKDFALIAVNFNESADVVKKFFKEYKLTFTALLDSDGEIGAAFGIRSIPATYILDKNGGIIGKVFGPRQWDSKESIALFELLIKESDLPGISHE